MPFEVFVPNARRAPRGVFVRMVPRGEFVLSAAARKLLGCPDKVVLMYDHEHHAVGFRPAAPDEVYSYTLRKNGVVSGRAFRLHFDIVITESRRYPAELENGVLVIQLDKGVAERSTQ